MYNSLQFHQFVQFLPRLYLTRSPSISKEGDRGADTHPLLSLCFHYHLLSLCFQSADPPKPLPPSSFSFSSSTSPTLLSLQRNNRRLLLLYLLFLFSHPPISIIGLFIALDRASGESCPPRDFFFNFTTPLMRCTTSSSSNPSRGSGSDRERERRSDVRRTEN